MPDFIVRLLFGAVVSAMLVRYTWKIVHARGRRKGRLEQMSPVQFTETVNSIIHEMGLNVFMGLLAQHLEEQHAREGQ